MKIEPDKYCKKRKTHTPLSNHVRYKKTMETLVFDCDSEWATAATSHVKALMKCPLLPSLSFFFAIRTSYFIRRPPILSDLSFRQCDIFTATTTVYLEPATGKYQRCVPGAAPLLFSPLLPVSLIHRQSRHCMPFHERCSSLHSNSKYFFSFSFHDCFTGEPWNL